TQFWLTWDASAIYVGWVGGDSSFAEHRNLAFDLDPSINDTTSTLTYASAQFGANAQPEYIVQYSTSSTLLASRQQGGTFVDTSAPVAVTGWFDNPSGGTGSGFLYGAVPGSCVSGQTGFWCGSFNTSGNANRTLDHELYFTSTGSGLSPNAIGLLLPPYTNLV